MNPSHQILILLLQNLDPLLKEHVLLGLLKSRMQPQRNISFFLHNDHYVFPDPVCVRVCVLAYLSLPLSPDQRSSSLAGVFVGSSFPQPPSSSSDLAQCAGMEPELPVTGAHSQTRKKVMMMRFGKIRITVYHKYVWILALYPVTYGYYLLELPAQVHFCR